MPCTEASTTCACAYACCMGSWRNATLPRREVARVTAFSHSAGLRVCGGVDEAIHRSPDRRQVAREEVLRLAQRARCRGVDRVPGVGTDAAAHARPAPAGGAGSG